MLRLRTHVLICVAVFVALLVVGWGGALLESMKLIAPPTTWRWPLLALLFVLVLGLAFSAVPVVVLLVTGVQGRGGGPGATLAPPRWQRTIVFVLWGLMAVGAAIAIPASILLGAFDELGAQAGVAGADPGPAQGTLVAKPGMTITQMRRASTLAIEPRAGTAAPATVSGGRVFDFVVAGTAIRFPRCRYYSISTFTDDRQRIQGMSVGTSTGKLARTALEAANAQLRSRLAADGWLAGRA